MRFYIASSFKYKASCETIKTCLESLGHTIPDIWWNIDAKDYEVDDWEWYAIPQVQAIASRHWKAIDNSDAVILVCPYEGYGEFNGAAVEVGYAIAKNIPVFSIGNLKRSAMYLPLIKCSNMHELIEAISIFALEPR